MTGPGPAEQPASAPDEAVPDKAVPDKAVPDAGVPDAAGPDAAALARLVVTVMTGRRQTVAVAESLTGGLLAASLVEVPGASAVFRGGIVAYATDLKAALLGVPARLLERYGAVHADVAAAMAEGVRARLGATFGVATTGVAGPDPADGQPAGTVHIAAAGPSGAVRRQLSLAGDRRSIRDQTVTESLRLLRGVLAA